MARRPLSDADVLRCLQGAVDVAGGQRAWAARHGLNQSHVSKALLGKRPVPASVLAALGLRELPGIRPRRGGTLVSKYGKFRCAVDGQVYKSPDPEFAYRLLLSHDIDAVRGRWPHLTEYGVGKILQQGKRLVTGSDGKLGRSQEELARIVEAVFRLGSPTDAARELGLHESAVRSALHTTGHKEYPRLSAAERGRRGHASRVAARRTPP